MTSETGIARDATQRWGFRCKSASLASVTADIVV